MPAGHVFRRSAGEARFSGAVASTEGSKPSGRRWPRGTRWRTGSSPFGGGRAEPPGRWRRRSDGWAEAAELLLAYARAAAEHTRCTKHRNPKQNSAVLALATREHRAGALSGRTLSRLRAAVSGMVAKRGEPASARLTEVRRTQAGTAAQPADRDLARVAAARLAQARSDEGLITPEDFLGPTTATEGVEHDVPAAAAMPTSVGRTLRLSRAALVEVLVADGTISSSEAPQLTAETVAAAYADPALGRLMGATYAAFRRRRSLLLVDLAK